MNILVLGAGRGAGALRSECARSGISLTELEDLDQVRSIAGQPGEFAIDCARGRIDASYIVILADGPALDAAPPGALSLEDGDALDALPPGALPVAFVLDHPEDSPARDARAALERACRLAARRRRVVYLAKHIRTAGDGLEALYRRARELGVLFCRYGALAVGRNEGGAFHIELTDGTDNLALDAAALVFAAPPGQSGARERLARLLRLRTDERGPSEGCHHLFPARTSRRGVYFLDPAACSGEDELLARVRSILAEIARARFAAAAGPGLRERLENPDGYAQVDAEKCAFCYTCYRVCPHAAMAPDHEASAMKNLREGCAGCGICAALCPARAISMEGRGGDGAGADRGRLTLFGCQHSGGPALEAIREALEQGGARVSQVPVRCGGDLGAEAILSALAGGGRALVAVCMDDACRHFEGNKRAARQVERARAMLRASGLDEGRVRLVQLSHAMPAALDEVVREMACAGWEEGVR